MWTSVFSSEKRRARPGRLRGSPRLSGKDGPCLSGQNGIQLGHGACPPWAASVSLSGG